MSNALFPQYKDVRLSEAAVSGELFNRIIQQQRFGRTIRLFTDDAPSLPPSFKHMVALYGMFDGSFSGPQGGLPMSIRTSQVDIRYQRNVNTIVTLNKIAFMDLYSAAYPEVTSKMFATMYLVSDTPLALTARNMFPYGCAATIYIRQYASESLWFRCFGYRPYKELT